MARLSTIARLPAAMRQLIEQQRRAGRTIEEILAELRARDVQVSKTSLGRHIQLLDASTPEGHARDLARGLEDLRRIRAGVERIADRLAESER